MGHALGQLHLHTATEQQQENNMIPRMLHSIP
jgi:hypothetical protein